MADMIQATDEAAGCAPPGEEEGGGPLDQQTFCVCHPHSCFNG